MLNNQELLYLLIISIILMTLMFDSGVILKGEIRCWSLSGVKGLRNTGVSRVIVFDVVTSPPSRALYQVCNLSLRMFREFQVGQGFGLLSVYTERNAPYWTINIFSQADLNIQLYDFFCPRVYGLLL